MTSVLHPTDRHPAVLDPTDREAAALAATLPPAHGNADVAAVHAKRMTFPALDGVRALAVGAVVATHAAYWTGRYVNGSFNALFARLDSGVAVFFVLSGFLLARPWLIAAVDGSAMPSVPVYFWRRALRILPLYWIAVILSLLLIVQRPAITAGDWVRHFSLLQIYQLGWWPRGGLSQTWSLCTEVSFYLVLPFIGAGLVCWTRRFGWHPVHLLVGCALLAGVSVAWTYLIYEQDWALRHLASLWLPAYLSWFAGGIALAVVQVHTHAGGATVRWHRRMNIASAVPGCFLAVGGALFALSLTPIAGPLGLSTTAQNTTAVVRNLLYAAFAMAVVFPAIFSPTSLVYRFLATPVMRKLGEISYGVFLLHLMILQGVMNLLGYHFFTGSFVYLFTLTTLLSVAAALLSFRWVEEPMMRLRRLVGGRRVGGRRGGGRLVGGPARRHRRAPARRPWPTAD